MSTENVSAHPVYGISVTAYGARGDGSGDDAPALQAALDAGAPVVVVPSGVYRVGQTLRVRSGTRLCLHPAAVIRQADGAGRDSANFVLTNADPERGDCDITITGGIWDGNAAGNTRGPDQPGSYTGVLLNFFNVRRLTLSGLELRNPVSYYTRFCRMNNFLIERIRFRTAVLRPNQDGIHLGGDCADGTIRHIDARGPGTPNDDIVALNADDANQRAQNLGKVNGPIRRVRVHDLFAEDGHTLVRLLSCWSPVEDIDIEDVRGGCQICAVNIDAARDCAVPVFDPRDPAYADGAGHLARVRIRHLHVYRSSGRVTKALVDLQTRVHDFIIEDFERDLARDACLAAPTFRAMNLPRGTQVMLEGIDDAQRAASRFPAGTATTRMVVADEESGARYRATATLASGDTLVLPGGGFRRLQAESPV